MACSSAAAGLRRDLGRRLGRVVRAPIMVEEFITDERGAYTSRRTTAMFWQPHRRHRGVAATGSGRSQVSATYTEAWQPLPSRCTRAGCPTAAATIRRHASTRCCITLASSAPPTGPTSASISMPRTGLRVGEFLADTGQGRLQPFADRYFEQICARPFRSSSSEAHPWPRRAPPVRSPAARARSGTALPRPRRLR